MKNSKGVNNNNNNNNNNSLLNNGEICKIYLDLAHKNQ